MVAGSTRLTTVRLSYGQSTRSRTSKSTERSMAMPHSQLTSNAMLSAPKS